MRSRALCVCLAGSDLHYWHCRRILELLEAAEQGRAKNIFGQVGGQGGKWAGRQAGGRADMRLLVVVV